MLDINIYLIEDRLSFQKKLNTALSSTLKSNFGYLQFKITSIANVIDFYKKIEHQNFSSTDIFIVDIDLNTYFDGIMVGKKIRKQNTCCKIIYLTSFENKAIEIINANISPEGYVLKSSNLDNVTFQIVEHLKKIISEYTTTDKHLLIDTGYQKHLIAYQDILYISLINGMRNSLLLHSTKQEILFTGTLSKIKKELLSPPFILNLKSYIINFENIQSLIKADGLILFMNERELEVGKQVVRKIELFQKGIR